MDVKRLFLVVMLLVFSSFVFGLTPMGPPVPQLNKGQWQAGVDYSYSKQDIKLTNGSSPGGGPSFTMDNLTAHYLAAKGSYGVTDKWQMSLSLGGGFVRGDEGINSFHTNHDGRVIGFGTKVKLFDYKETHWGSLFQFMWAKAGGKLRAGGRSWDAEEKFFEMQIALGPTYQMNEKVKLYGGPFFHYLDGSLEAKPRTGGGKIDYDLAQNGIFGAYIGGQIGLTENTLFNVEYQHTGGADSLGLSWAYKF